MKSESRPLDVLLAEAGCTDEFIEYAMKHHAEYRGNVNKFTDWVELLRQNDAENEHHAATDRATMMDGGVKQAERDYTGDNLTSGGYDFVNQNRRW